MSHLDARLQREIGSPSAPADLLNWRSLLTAIARKSARRAARSGWTRSGISIGKLLRITAADLPQRTCLQNHRLSETDLAIRRELDIWPSPLCAIHRNVSYLTSSPSF